MHIIYIKYRCASGYNLGPLLFIIYMNDIHKVNPIFHAISFADDTNLTSTFGVNIDNNCTRLQLSTNKNKELKHTNMVLNKQTVIWYKENKINDFHHKQRNIENLIHN